MSCQFPRVGRFEIIYGTLAFDDNGECRSLHAAYGQNIAVVSVAILKRV